MDGVLLETGRETAVAEKGATAALVASTGSGRTVLKLVGKGRKIRVIVRVARVARVAGVVAAPETGGISLAVSLVATEILFRLGEGAAKKALEEEDCALKPGESILDRFVDGTHLADGFLFAHEGPRRGLGHTIERHVQKDPAYLLDRIASGGIVESSSFDDHPTAERIIRSAVMADLAAISDWGSKRADTRKDSFYRGNPAHPIGYGYQLRDPLGRIHKRHDAQVRMLQKTDCSIFILSAFPE